MQPAVWIRPSALVQTTSTTTRYLVNDLVGFQLGNTLNYCVGRRAAFYGMTRMGIYGNHAQFNSDLGVTGTRAYASAGPFLNQNYMISGSKTDVAFLGELGTGVHYRLTPKWSANVGYRAIAV